jgi:hypothetical protein
MLITVKQHSLVTDSVFAAQNYQLLASVVELAVPNHRFCPVPEKEGNIPRLFM